MIPIPCTRLRRNWPVFAAPSGASKHHIPRNSSSSYQHFAVAAERCFPAHPLRGHQARQCIDQERLTQKRSAAMRDASANHRWSVSEVADRLVLSFAAMTHQRCFGLANYCRIEVTALLVPAIVTDSDAGTTPIAPPLALLPLVRDASRL